jgi:DNA helicase II / ATP-dependent DNA helicase PcrA
MDSFDQVRLKASRRSNSVIQEGCNPLKPLAVVEAAAKSLELDLIELSSGDPALKGARALYDDQSGAICFEQTSVVADRALLIAHELGHAELHAGSSSCDSSEIDPSQTSQNSPTGIQRVEDYGAKERRELQANVYARELLLPRQFVADLHLIQECNSKDIADQTGLPLALVRQQLIDALLLPKPEEQSEPGENAVDSRPCDPSQIRAVSHRGSPYQLQAGPGTGKTKTLVARVKSLIDEGIDPAGTLVLTFSNRAAGELYERLAQTVPTVVDKIWIGTFHSFGLDLIRRFHDKLSLSSDPALFDRSDAIAVLEEQLPTLALRHYRNLWDPSMVLRDIVAAISRAKDELVDSTQYRRLAVKMHQIAIAEDDIEHAEKCLEIADVYDRYEDAKRHHGGVDFGDLILLPTRLLEADEATRLNVRLRHRHVLVDEYQDVNRASARLLQLLAGAGERLWVVGDARQSIYRFRGASSLNMGNFSVDYPGAKVDRLEMNYRSVDQIVQTFTDFSKQMLASKGMLPLALTAIRGGGPYAPEIRSFETLDDEIGGLAAAIKEIESAGIRLRNQAVLCRTNARLNEIAQGLENRGIPVLHLGSLFERDEVRDLLAVLAFIGDSSGDALVRLAAMERYAISLQDVYRVLGHFRQVDGSAHWNLSAPIDGVTAEGTIALARLWDDIGAFNSNMQPWDIALTYLLDKTDRVRRFAQDSSVSGQMKAVALWQFLNFIRKPSPTRHGSPISRLLDHVRQLVLLAEERDLRQVPAAAQDLNAVRLMTVHSSKGLEFEAVHIPGLTVAGFPSSNRWERCPCPTGMSEGDGSARDTQAEEEECLFFVALSRARDRLLVSHAMKQRNGNARNPSAYLSRLPRVGRKDVATTQVLLSAIPQASPYLVPISLPPDWLLTDSKLTTFEKCPRRFFYTHVLGLRGARKGTAFSRTHDCLYELIRRVHAKRLQGAPTLAEILGELEEIWTKSGPTGHAYEKEYRALAERLAEVLLVAGAERVFHDGKPLPVDLPTGRVWVEPSDVSRLADGRISIRRVRTGHRRSTEYDRLEYTLYLMAARASFGGEGVVHALHLSDEVEEIVSVTQAKLNGRMKKSQEMLASIVGGDFPPEVDAVTCPRCPHFFVCAATPSGPLVVLTTRN